MGVTQPHDDDSLEPPFVPGSGQPERFVPSYGYRLHCNPILVMDVFERMRTKDTSVEPLFEQFCESVLTLADVLRDEPEHSFAEAFPSVGDTPAYRAKLIHAYGLFHQAYICNHLPNLEAAYLRLYALWTFPKADQLNKTFMLPSFAGSHKKTPELKPTVCLEWRDGELVRTPGRSQKLPLDRAFLDAFARLHEYETGFRHGWRAKAARECGVTTAQINVRLKPTD